jgi:hypothetical protein
MCWGTWPLYVTCLRYLSVLNTKCDVLEYWRRRSVSYSGLFTTSLVVTTITFYNVRWPSDVASQRGPGSSALVLWSPWIWPSLICVGPSLDLLLLPACWSTFCDLLQCSPSVFCHYSAAPEVGCWRPGEKTPWRKVVLALLWISTIRLPWNFQWLKLYFVYRP